LVEQSTGKMGDIREGVRQFLAPLSGSRGKDIVEQRLGAVQIEAAAEPIDSLIVVAPRVLQGDFLEDAAVDEQVEKRHTIDEKSRKCQLVTQRGLLWCVNRGDEVGVEALVFAVACERL
jgi:hypothetical protein